MSHLKICDFVERELQYFRSECNFTDEELEFFNLRAKGKSIIQICVTMSVGESKATDLSNKVKRKIIKVL